MVVEAVHVHIWLPSHGICKVYNFAEPPPTIRQPVKPFYNLYFMFISKQCCFQGVVIILCLTFIQCSETFIPVLDSTTVPIAVPLAHSELATLFTTNHCSAFEQQITTSTYPSTPPMDQEPMLFQHWLKAFQSA